MPKIEVTRIGGWIRHNCFDKKPAGLSGMIEAAWFDPNENDERNVGFSIMAADKDLNNVSPAWDHIFAYRKIKEG